MMGRKSEFRDHLGEKFKLTAEERHLKSVWECGREPNLHTHFCWLLHRAKVWQHPVLLDAVAKLKDLGRHTVSANSKRVKNGSGYEWLRVIAAETSDARLLKAVALLEDLKLDRPDLEDAERDALVVPDRLHRHFEWLVDRGNVAPYPMLLAAIAKLKALRLHTVSSNSTRVKSRSGYAWLKAVATETNDTMLLEATTLLEELKLNGRDWQKHERRLRRAFWGDPDAEAFCEHFEAEKKASSLRREGPDHQGCSDRLAIARVAARIDLKASTFEAAVKAGYAYRKKKAVAPEPSVHRLRVRVPQGRGVRDPADDFQVLSPGDHEVGDTLFWRRRIADGDVALIQTLRSTTIPKT